MMHSRPAGFTLLELIVVIGVFSVFAAMAYGGLDRVMLARTRIEQSLNRTEEYQRAYLRLRTDFENAAPRGIRDGDGQVKAVFMYDGYSHRVEFTRGGWANLLNLPRASLQRIGYFLDDAKLENKTLVRRTWPVLDRAPQTVPVDTVLLEHVEELKWRFLDKNQAWQDAWPPPGSNLAPPTAQAAALAQTSGLPQVSEAPRAVELTLRTRDWTDLRLLFKVGPDQLIPALPPT
ncbi:MAG: gspJ [Nevskia sp.]|nr:gspJ [Nevskia sp.]